MAMVVIMSLWLFSTYTAPLLLFGETKWQTTELQYQDIDVH